MRRIIKYSGAELAFIKRNRALPHTELHKLFVDRFHRNDVSYENIRGICKRNGWHNGLQINRFTKGNSAYSDYKPLGTERVNRGYIQRKVNDERGPAKSRWHFVHRINFEAIYGPVPTGHVLKCLDGNKSNTDPSNWESVPNSVLWRLNRRDFNKAPAALKPTIMAVAKLDTRKTSVNGDEARRITSAQRRNDNLLWGLRAVISLLCLLMLHVRSAAPIESLEYASICLVIPVDGPRVKIRVGMQSRCGMAPGAMPPRNARRDAY